MKNIVKRFYALLLVAALCICTLGTTAFAAENTTDESATEAIELRSDGLSTRGTINQTFPMTTYHRGSNRTYQYPKLDYHVTVTAADGSYVSNVIAVRLYKKGNSVPVSTTTVAANGHTIGVGSISITPGAEYYFTYQLASGTSTSLSVNMIIVDHK